MQNKQVSYNQRTSFKVTSTYNKWRIDKLLIHRMPWYSRNQIHEFIDSGEFTLNKKKAKKGARVNTGDIIVREFYKFEPKLDDITIDIIYEDEDLLVVNKPQGLTVHPNSAYQSRTLIQILKDEYKYDDIRLVHRLDKETSGIILLAKGKDNCTFFMNKFQKREVEKIYIAVVDGIVKEKDFSVKIKLGLSKDNIVKIKNYESEDGYFSHTDFRVLEQYKNYALVQALLHTGRQHQIRAHLSWYGNYVIGDKIYGVDEKIFDEFASVGMTKEMLRRLMVKNHLLHSWKLSFFDERKNKLHSFKTPIPRSFCNFIEKKCNVSLKEDYE